MADILDIKDIYVAVKDSNDNHQVIEIKNEADIDDQAQLDDKFEVIHEEEVEYVKPWKIEQYDRALEEAISKIKGVKDFSEQDLKELSAEIRRLGKYRKLYLLKRNLKHL